MAKITVNVRLFGTLRKYVIQYDPSKGVNIALNEGDTLRDLANMLGLPDPETKLYLVKSISQALSYQLHDSDQVSIFLQAGGG